MESKDNKKEEKEEYQKTNLAKKRQEMLRGYYTKKSDVKNLDDRFVYWEDEKKNR